MMSTKDTNPKQAIGARKPYLSTLSMPVLFEMGAAMLEGACKYGRHNYRDAGVRCSTYYDATLRHLAAWWEGEDVDPDSGVHHLAKALSCMMVLRDSMIQGNHTDDRPPVSPAGWLGEIKDQTKGILDRFPEPLPPFTIQDLPKDAEEL